MKEVWQMFSNNTGEVIDFEGDIEQATLKARKLSMLNSNDAIELSVKRDGIYQGRYKYVTTYINGLERK